MEKIKHRTIHFRSFRKSRKTATSILAGGLLAAVAVLLFYLFW